MLDKYPFFSFYESGYYSVIGYWDSAEIVQQWQVEKRFEPTINAEHRATLQNSWRSAIAQARHR